MELEHETFRNAKAANLYKASVLKKVGVLKKGRVGQLPTQGATYSGRSPTSLLPWLQGLLASPGGLGLVRCPCKHGLQNPLMESLELAGASQGIPHSLPAPGG